MTIKKRIARRVLACILTVLGMLILVAIMLVVTKLASASEFHWKHFGGAPYATSRAEAMQKRESAFRELGFPSPVVVLLMKATTKHGKATRPLTNGDHLSAMLSKGGVVHKDVIVDFIKPPVSGKMGYSAPAEMWQVSWQGRAYKLILPKICNNWSSILPSNGCYIIPFDYRHTPGVVWDAQHRAHISAHIDATENELEDVSNDQCFGVGDTKGFRKPFHRCESCGQGEYPPSSLAKAVGLPANEPNGVMSFYLQDGKGYLSFPKSFARRWMLFCADVKMYPVSISGYRDWQAVSRFNIVKKKEIRKTIKKGVLDRTLSGKRHY